MFLQADAKIFGTLEWTFADATSVKGEIGGDIEFTIEGVAQAELEVSVIKVAGGVKAGAKASIGAKVVAARSEKPSTLLTGRIYGNGVTIYSTSYYEIEGWIFNSKGESSHEDVVVAPWEYPSSGAEIELSDW